MSANSSTILVADDDPDERILLREAFSEVPIPKDLRFVSDGVELMDYLLQRGKYASEGSAPRPSVILLDLNMPKKDGREALAEIKQHPDLRSIPVVVLTTSNAEEDVRRCYQIGANSFITKPMTFESLVSVIETLGTYWMATVRLPPTEAFR